MSKREVSSVIFRYVVPFECGVDMLGFLYFLDDPSLGEVFNPFAMAFITWIELPPQVLYIVLM